MRVVVPSFAKINLGLRIGPRRADGFHELRTIYQTMALHDRIGLRLMRGSGIEIHCQDPRVPTDSSNTCFRTVTLAMQALNIRGRVVMEIEKKLPVQGGLGAASSNAVAALVALERAAGKALTPARRFAIAAEVGSDLPLFLLGGTVLGVGRGEEVYPLPDLPALSCVIALPKISVSTPKAFADWERLQGRLNAQSACQSGAGGRRTLSRFGSRSESAPDGSKLTGSSCSDKMGTFHHEISAWLIAGLKGRRRSGVSIRSGGRAESLLLDLVRTGIMNDFEEVVFPQYPEIAEVKRVLRGSGASYASLSGSGSAIYGLFLSPAQAQGAVRKLRDRGIQAMVTATLPRPGYWKQLSSVRW